MAENVQPHSALTIENISLRYGTHKALDDISMEIASGTLTALIGPNGAGKSSIVKAICGRVALEHGSVKISGYKATTPQARHNLGVAPQRAALYNYLSAEENLTCFARQAGMKHDNAKRKTDEILSIIGMKENKDTFASRMSGGMRQRVNIGAAIIHAPKFIILDEPAAGLDPQGINQVNLLIKRLKEEGFAILLITHDMRQATSLADEVIILANGKIRAKGTLQNVILQLCDSAVTLSVQTTHHEKLQSLGFTSASNNSDFFSKAMDSRDDAISLLSKLQAMKIPTEECTIAAPNLSNALDAAIANPGKFVS